MRTILHIDVNSAFLSWEAVYRLSHGDKIDLRDIPSAVAGDPEKRRGVILAKSTPTKAYGVRTGESLYSALKKCPNMKVVSPTPGIYKEYSKSLMDMICEYTDTMQQCSIDEAFADVTQAVRIHGISPLEFADRMRERIHSELGFTVNIGISCNKLLAKAASELKKPDRTHTLYPEEISEKYWTLPVREMIGVGGRVEEKLKRAGIKTIGDIANSNELYLKSIFKSYGKVLYERANGIDQSPVEPGGEVKSIGNSTTTPQDIESIESACEYIMKLSETVGRRLRQKGLKAHCIGVEIKYSDFKKEQMQSTLRYPVAGDMEIYKTAKNIFRRLWKCMPARHVGVRASQLQSASEEQLSFLESGEKEFSKLDEAIDDLRSKYGEDIVKRMV